jgi:hypothetical protein
MRRIKLNVWKELIIDESGKAVETEVSLLSAVSSLINNTDPAQMPRGLDKFRIFHRINDAFLKAEASKELVLEEAEYKFIRDILDRDVPANWGAHPDISKAIMDFIDAKEE